MSGQHIIIEQLRAEVERLRDDRADLQERCNRLTGERNAALLLMKDEEARAEKAERFIATADSEWKARAEKAERERDEARANYAFMVERAADQKLDGYRELGARAAAAEERAERAERERDARPDISAEDARAFMMFKPVPARDSREGPVMHALRAHAAKAVKP